MGPIRRAYARFREIARTAAERRELKRLASHEPRRLVIGASGIHDPGWIATEIRTLNLLHENDWRRYFRPSSVDAILAEHVWEHLTTDEAFAAACNCYRYLKPGGYLRIAVPDGLFPDPHYIDDVKPGGTGWGSDDHKVLYTYRALGALLEKAGFTVDALEYFDEEGVFRHKPWDIGRGKIHRSRRFDKRNTDESIGYTSIIIDAVK